MCPPKMIFLYFLRDTFGRDTLGRDTLGLDTFGHDTLGHRAVGFDSVRQIDVSPLIPTTYNAGTRPAVFALTNTSGNPYMPI
jgi:hypothetical protein